MRVQVVIVSNRFPGMSALALAGVGAAVTRTVADVEAQAKVRCPVDTGALRASISGAMTGDTEGEVSTGQNYAPFVEYGTARGSPAQPFMTPAAEAVRPSFQAAVAQVLKGLA